MNAPLLREVLVPEDRTLCAPGAQAPQALATQGVWRMVWESRFGPMLIEVIDGTCRVNGQPVQPARRPAATAPALIPRKVRP